MINLRNRKSPRLQSWDYRSDASYFITICTHSREHYFGAIENHKMILSNQGVIAEMLWFEIQHHAKNVELGEFVVMPNHVHGILILGGNNERKISNSNPLVGTRHALSLPMEPKNAPSLPKPIGQQRFQNQGKNTISSIIGSYKSAVTKHCNRKGLDFVWQTRFHDHIIRSEESFYLISNYIKDNPANWKDDKFF